MATLTLFAPAKLNLFLAITGRREDGFHDLVSVVAQLGLGDELTVDTAGVESGEFTLTCNDPEVPIDDSNLVLKAARAFAAAVGWKNGAAFRLEKRVPMGAGLGGGSSDAVATLRALNRLAGEPLNASTLARIGATLGSDCPLFLHGGPVVMRGRGERIEPLASAGANRLRGRRVLVFKPEFGVPTAWSYRRLAEAAAESASNGKEQIYFPAPAAEARLAAWIAEPTATVETLLFNTLERPAFGKYVALPTMLALLRQQFGVAAGMTGSGSACFAFVPDSISIEPIQALISDGWGKRAFFVDTRIL